MKQLSVFTSRYKTPRGTTLVELVMVMGISSLIVVGSFAWFSNKRTTDFADSTRQIESILREAQNEINTNSIPGYSANNSDCNNATRSNCVLKPGDQVLASGVGIDTSTQASDSARTIQIYYFKAGPDVNVPNATLGSVSAYATRRVVLPVGLKFKQIKVFNRTGTTCPAAYANYIDPATVGDALNRTWSIVTFRKGTGIYNSFTGAYGNIITSGTAAGSGPLADQRPSPPFNTTDAPSILSATNPKWYASWGGDNPAIYTAGTTTLPSLPCAVMWRIESDEQSGGVARFTAEVVFNLDVQRITVQRR